MYDIKMPKAGGVQPAKPDFSVKAFSVQEKEGSNLRTFACIDLDSVFTVTNLHVLKECFKAKDLSLEKAAKRPDPSRRKRWVGESGKRGA